MPAPTGWTNTTEVPLSGNDCTDSLIAGSKWGGSRGSGATVSFSFPVVGSIFSIHNFLGYGGTHTDREPWSDWYQSLTLSQRSAARTALQSWSNVANINFLEVADNSS